MEMETRSVHGASDKLPAPATGGETTRTNRPKTTRELSKEAISLALEGDWEKAAVLNRVILDATPNDAETMNRLGKALMESGQYGEAREVLTRVVEAAPYNNIARKNLTRLAQLEEAPAPAGSGLKGVGSARSFAARSFIEESGKSGATVLQKPGSARAAAPGDPLDLVIQGSSLCVYRRGDEYLGRVEPKLARRLVRLMQAGNRYEAAVIGVKDEGTSIIIRETFRHPSLQKVCSFPSRAKDDPRMYLRENVLRYLDDTGLDNTGLDDDDEGGLVDPGAPDDGSEWDE